MKNILHLVLILLPFSLFSQSQYNWEPTRELYPAQSNDEASYYLKHYTGYEYVYEGQEKELALYVTQHTILKINTDQAIESGNKIYIPMADVKEIIDIKARSITPAGKIVNLDKSNIKELEDEEQSGYRIFAIEGAEIGGEIEYLHTRKLEPKYFVTQYMQFSNSIKNASFLLSCPQNLEFDFRSYNGLPDVQQTDDSEEVNVYELHVEEIPSLSEEEFSAYNASRKRIEGKLAYNSYNGNGRLLTFAEASKRLYNQVYELDKKEQKEINTFVSSLPLAKLSEREKIAFLEHHIKSNFYIDVKAGAGADNIDFILKSKFSNNRGFTRLMANSLKALNIPHQLVLTCDRTDAKFDHDFDSWNFLDDYLIYLENEQEYIAPYNLEYRMGIVPANLTANYGLFIKPYKIRDFYYPVGEVRYIEAQEYQTNMDIMDMEVSIDSDLTASTVSLKRSFNGITSTIMKSYMPLMEEAKKKEWIDEIIKYVASDAEITTSGLTNTDFSYKKWLEPLVIEGNFKTSSYFETAGNVILLKVGEMIGEQSELYQEKERLTRVENDYNRGYLRKITVHLPEGYKIENTEDLKMDFSTEKDGKTVMLFKSDFTLDANKLEIEIEEHYDEIYWPKDDFESFRKVINAAADFNKVTLVLKPI